MNNKIVIILFIIPLALQACTTTIKCSIKEDLNIIESSNLAIKQSYDPINIYEEIEKQCKAMGFNIVNESESHNIYLTYNYVHYYDAIHNTLNILTILIVNRVNNEVLASASYAGDSPSGVEGIIKSTFRSLEDKINSR